MTVAISERPDVTLHDVRKTDKRVRILLVDDDQRNLLALSQVLEEVADVVTADSGPAALRYLLKGEFAVILLDVFMPGMDGYELAALIRQREQTARVPIIFLSAVNKETEHLMRGYAMGAVDYVFKPVDPVILQSKVAVFVDLYEMRLQVENKNREELLLRDQAHSAELEKLQIQTELEASHLRQAAMLEALPLALFEASVSKDGLLERKFVGGDLSKIAGRQARAVEAGQMRWEDGIDPEDLLAMSRLCSPGATSDMLSLEYRWTAPGEDTRHFIERCVRVPGSTEGEQWAGTLIDVTDRKQLELQLVQAGKLDAIGQLTGGIAHDFNNLLAAVIGGLQLLQKRVAFGEREQIVVDHMRRAAEKGAELVRRMMAFARKQDLHPVSIEPKDLCESVAGLVEHALGGIITVEWKCPDTGLNIFVDRSQLELALVNLIINARDAMPSGGKIRVAVKHVTPALAADEGLKAGEYICICVADEGTGIHPDVVDKIVEPFFTTKEAGKGTGLGLSMVAGFAQQSGGKLDIYSEQGKGTQVSIYLPATAEKQRERQPDADISNHGGATVRLALVVDDDETVRTVVCEQLRDWGVAVVTAASGVQALNLSSDPALEFDLVLTDFAMPGMNGAELIGQLRRQRPRLKCVLMTGYASEELKAAIPDRVEVIHKPLSVEVLRNTVAVGVILGGIAAG